MTAPELRQLLAEFRIAEAMALVQERAGAGSTEALILLSEMSETCGWSVGDGPKRSRLQNDEYQTKVRAGARAVPAALHESIEIALAVDRQWLESWIAVCSSARFDHAEIMRQLRIKADAGDEASLRQLARATADRSEARRFLLSAAMLGDKDAQVELASSYYHELTYEKQPVDIPRMIYWLEAAAKHSPHAQYMLGECRLHGCDGRPADTEAALALLRGAARGGDGFALKMLADTIAGGTGSFTSDEQYAWLVFERHWLDSGCVAPMSYPLVRIDNWQRLQSVGQSLSPYGLKSAQALADQYWREHGASGRSARGCD